MSFKTQKSCLRVHARTRARAHTHTHPTMLSPMRHKHKHDMAILEKLGHNKAGAH